MSKPEGARYVKRVGSRYAGRAESLGAPGVRKIAQQFGVDPSAVQRIGRPAS
jgi:hypothetical protein